MVNEENLVSIGDQTTEKQRDITRKGGIASGKAKRMRKLIREAIEEFLAMKAPDAVKNAFKSAFPDMDMAELTNTEAMTLAQLQKAIKGDAKAFELVRDTGGQKPVDKQEIIGNVQKIFINKEDREEVDKHIDESIGG